MRKLSIKITLNFYPLPHGGGKNGTSSPAGPTMEVLRVLVFSQVQLWAVSRSLDCCTQLSNAMFCFFFLCIVGSQDQDLPAEKPRGSGETQEICMEVAIKSLDAEVSTYFFSLVSVLYNIIIDHISTWLILSCFFKTLRRDQISSQSK